MESTLYVLNTFHSILAYSDASDQYKYVNQDNQTYKINRLSCYYDITDNQVLMLAYIVKYYPNSIHRQSIKNFMFGTGRAFSEDSLSDLREKGFIIYDQSDDNQDDFIRLSETAYNAFCNNSPQLALPFDNWIQEIKESSIDDFFSTHWQNLLFESLSSKTDESLNNTLNQLGFFNYSKNVQISFLLIVRQFAQKFLEPLAFQKNECNNFSDVNFALLDADYDIDELKDDLAALVKAGLVDSLPIEEETKETNRFVLSAKVAGLLFRGHEDIIKYDEISKYASIIKNNDIEEKLLFFSSDVEEEINHLRKMISIPGFKRALAILRKQKRNPAIQSLLWGPPGTGKTEIIKQFARESGRDLIILDLSKVTGSLWGASEKNYRALFRAYNYMVEISDNFPILLLNEADAILSKRLTSIERSVDKAENALSNVVLQEFEDMSGILIATTNLIDNLDTAFDRRFLFKTNLNKPDATARCYIWKSNIPCLSEGEAQLLADKYEMSGAQISNVVTKRNLAELYFDGDRGLSYIEDLCEKELSTENRHKKYRKIGF